MPSCCIINCKSRTYYAEKKGIIFYRFPNEENIRQAWINACQRSEESIKIDSARICSLHFDDDCFITKWTDSIKAPPKQLRRLKVGSIPTKMLTLEKTRKRKMSNSDMAITSKRIKVLQNFRIPTYSDLLKCNERKEKESRETSKREEEEEREEEEVVSPTCIPNEIEVQETFERNKTEEKGKREEKACKINVQDKKKGHNYAIKRNINQEVGNDETVVTNTLLELLMDSEKRNKELLNENKELTKINQQLNIQVKELQTNTTQNDPIITKMEKNIQEKVNIFVFLSEESTSSILFLILHKEYTVVNIT
ncbi:uncharacterized protein LOC143904771 isoform X1 [Temnothorax americanus]|uniref:uncharacterized protein LOC143904771 isoform X1 n=1 Tax=Temnothorax americanus TaxID=1964332 RepID=UPI004068EDA4